MNAEAPKIQVLTICIKSLQNIINKYIIYPIIIVGIFLSNSAIPAVEDKKIADYVRDFVILSHFPRDVIYCSQKRLCKSIEKVQFTDSMIMPPEAIIKDSPSLQWEIYRKTGCHFNSWEKIHVFVQAPEIKVYPTQNIKIYNILLREHKYIGIIADDFFPTINMSEMGAPYIGRLFRLMDVKNCKIIETNYLSTQFIYSYTKFFIVKIDNDLIVSINICKFYNNKKFFVTMNIRGSFVSGQYMFNVDLGEKK